MKQCLNCGHENANDAERCEECGWAVPKIHPYARAGRMLKLGAGSILVVLAVVELIIWVVVTNSIPKGYEDPIGPAASLAFYSGRWFLISMTLGFVLFWLGDYLKRNY